MNCNEIRELISCMLDNELSAQDSAIVGEHLVECPECMRVFEAFHSISLSMEELEDVPDGFTNDVMDRIHTIAEAPKPKKKRGGYLRIVGLAGMAACFAIVMMAGTRFASTHKYVEDGSGDTAEYVQIQKTPKPVHHWYNFGNTPVPANASPAVTDIADPAVSDDGSFVDSDITEDPTSTPYAELMDPDVSPNASPDPDELDPEASLTPEPVVTPTPMPPMDLMFIEDLLIMDTEADFELFTEYPAYEVTVTDSNNAAVSLKVWTDGVRIYCKHEDSQTAWYTVGTAEQLTELLGEPAVTPVPETPSPTIPVPETPAPGTPTPAIVQPTPNAVKPTPSAVPTPNAVQPAPSVALPTPDTAKPTPSAVPTPNGIHPTVEHVTPNPDANLSLET